MAKRYGLVIDLERCTGCHTCTIACKAENKMEAGSGIRVETVGGGRQDVPAGKYPELDMHYLPIACMHCAEPPCRDACPAEAIYQRSDGLVLIDEQKCNGCQECIEACPYQALVYDAQKAIVRKCNLCLERIDQGFQPFCASCCGEEAIYFGDLSDPESGVSKLISERNAYILKPELATGPAICYCPPKSRRQAQSAATEAPKTGTKRSVTPAGKRVRVEPGETIVRTASPFGCGPFCGIMAHVKDGMLVKVEPGDFPGTSHICHRCLTAVKLVYHPDRLRYPMKRLGERGEGKWQRISWDEAMHTIAFRLKEISDRYGSSSLAWTTGGGVFPALATYAAAGFAGACGGTFCWPSGMGDAALPCADTACYGTIWPYGDDYTINFDRPALCLLWGDNCAETGPFKWRKIRNFKERGARLVVIDPRFTTTASKADEYIPIRPGTDAALALGMMNVILNKGLEDRSFITSQTVGPFLVRSDNGMFLKEKDLGAAESEKYIVWDTATGTLKNHDAPGIAPALTGVYRVKGLECRPAFQLLVELIQKYPPHRASEITEIPVDTITRLAIEYATMKPAASARSTGCTRGTFYGDLSIRAINTLAAITGNISFEGHKPFQLNMGAFMTRGAPNFMTLLGLYDAIISGEPYPIKALWLSRHNLMNQLPNFNKITRGLVPRLEFIVVADMFMNTSAEYADIVLPACSFYEYTDLASPIGIGGHNYLQLQQKVIEPLYESKSDFEMLAVLARTMGMEGYLEESAEEAVELVLASGDPSVEGITLEKLKDSPMPPAPHSVPDFATPSGRLEFYWEKLKEFGQELPVYLEPMESQRTPLAQKYPLSLFTAHTKYRHNSMFANVAWARELDQQPRLEMSTTDAQPRRIQDGDLVEVFNDRGNVKLRARVHQAIRPGLVSVCQGWSPGDYVEGSHQSLTHDTINPAQQLILEPNAAFYDTLVEVRKVEEM
ncbi:MAG: dehydrogenase [Chloroflexi bacterium]|nr:dehydrogenase [Chloroflexota bacterium]